MNPSSRPRRGILAVLGGGVATAVVSGAMVLGGGSSAAASGLTAFSSCEQLQAWGAEALSRQSLAFEEVGAPLAADAAAAGAESDGAGATAGAAASPPSVSTTAPVALPATDDEGGAPSDSTNVIVEGIDEPDLVERLGGDRALVVGGQTLAVADLSDASVEASARVPWGAQITYDGDAGVAWSVGYGDRGETVVQRFAVRDGSISEEGSWSTSGQLVSARRQGGELLVIATDGFYGPPIAFEGGSSPGVEDQQVTIPFEGGPVPCDQVLHPEGPAEPSSTLLAVLPVEGPLQPVRSTQVVGAGTNVHVTANAAYLATPSWDPADGSQSTGLHRFDLASLGHTGSGVVEGSLLNDFAMSEHDGHLRVAVTVGGGFFAIPADIDGGIGDGTGSGDSVTEPAPDEPVLDGPAGSPMVTDPPAPDAVQDDLPGAAADAPVLAEGEPVTTVPAEVEATEPMPVDPGDPVPIDPMPMPTVVEPPRDVPVINEIVVLDTEGDLDVVGRTPRFGHPGESLQGIRFEGDIAYAVTFLQTDPFYVVDLTDPAAPTVLGEVELPGFSAYLHPISATDVVGFGPDGEGRASAKLFDVSDRTNPRVVDSIVLGDESAVVWDHHAFTSLGPARFAVPASSWSYGLQPDCDVCGAALTGFENDVVVIAVSGGRLVEEQRITVEMAESALRVIPAEAGWGLLAPSSLTVVDGSGAVKGTAALG